jgi:hypothetical protein
MTTQSADVGLSTEKYRRHLRLTWQERGPDSGTAALQQQHAVTLGIEAVHRQQQV